MHYFCRLSNHYDALFLKLSEIFLSPYIVSLILDFWCVTLARLIYYNIYIYIYIHSHGGVSDLLLIWNATCSDTFLRLILLRLQSFRSQPLICSSFHRKTGTFGTEILLFLKPISHCPRTHIGEVLSQQFIFQRLDRNVLTTKI